MKTLFKNISKQPFLSHSSLAGHSLNAFTTGRVYSVDTVDGGRFYTDTNLAGNMFIGTQNSLGGFAGSLQIAGLIAHEGTHWYQKQGCVISIKLTGSSED